MAGALGHVPVLTCPDLAAFEDQQVSRQKLVDTAKQRVLAGDGACAEHLGKNGLIGLPLDEAARENRLDLRSEEQRVRRARPVERFDTEAIAYEQEAARRGVPDRERE